MSFFDELKRRNVFRVGIAYIIVAWLIAQVADLVFDNIAAPDWLMPAILFVLAMGFFLAIFFAWAFEMTPEGIKKEADVDRNVSITDKTGHKLDRAIIGILVIALGYFAYDKFVAAPGEPAMPAVAVEGAVESPVVADEPGSEEQSIAVLAFRDMSAAGDQDYFAEGIAEELLNALVRVKGLRVASRTSAFSFKDSELELPEIGHRLNVNHILEGSVRTSSDRIRVTAQLIDVNTDTHLWSEIYDRDSSDIFAVQAEITKHVVAELAERLGETESVEPTVAVLTSNTEAYRLYLRGRHLWRTRGRENLITAKVLLEQATELDPQFSRAWSNLSLVSQNLTGYDNLGPVDQYSSDSVDAMNRALALDPRNTEALNVKASQLENQCSFVEADKVYREALAIDPMDPTTWHWYGLTLLKLGHIDRAGEHILAGYDIDPLISALVSTLGNYYELDGDYENAYHYYREGAALGIYAGTAFEEGLARVWSGDYAGGREMMLAGATQYGFKNLDSVGRVLDVLQFGGDREALAKQLVEQSKTGVEFKQMGAELLSLLNSPLLFEVQDESICGEFSHRLLWVEGTKELRDHPNFMPYLESIGYTEYYREFGWPDVCTNENPELEGCY